MIVPFYSKHIVIAICLFVFAMGGYSAFKNRVQLLPEIDPPKVSFSISWPNASEEFLLSNIVEPYENILRSKLKNLDSILVKFGSQKVSFEVQFEYGVDLGDAEQQMRTLLSGVRTFPVFVKPLRFRQGGNNVSNQVVASYFFTSEQQSFDEQQHHILKELAEKQIASIPGVEKVELIPNIDSRVVIRLMPEKLTAFGLNLRDIRSDIKVLLQDHTGIFEDKAELFSGQYKSASTLESLRNATVALSDGVGIKLSQIAKVDIENAPTKWITRFNGQEGVLLRILRHKQDDLLSIQDAVADKLSKNTQALKLLGLEYQLTFDTGLFIKRAVMMMAEAIILGFVFSLIVSYIFFRQLTPTILSAIVTLLSVMGVLSVLYISGTSINVISLAGITFAIGMFVDSVLIFIEHLDRLPQSQKKSPEFVFRNMRKLIPALLASILTSIVVFFPILFNNEAEGQLFSGLALAFVSGLVIAFILTLLIVPVFVHSFMSKNKESKVKAYSVGWGTRLVLSNSLLRVITILVSTFGFICAVVMLMPSLSYLPSIKRDAIDIYIPLTDTESAEMIERELVDPLNTMVQELIQEPIKNYYVISLGRLVTVGIRLENNDDIPAVLSRLKSKLPKEFPDFNVITMHGNLFGGIEGKNNLKLYLHSSNKAWLAENQENIKALFEQYVPGVSIRFKPNLMKKKTVYDVKPNFENATFIGAKESELKTLFKALNAYDYLDMWSSNGETFKVYITMGDTSNLADYATMPYITSSGLQTFVGELLDFKQTNKIPPQIRLNSSNAVEVNIGIKDKSLTVSDVMASINNDMAPELKALMGKHGWFELEGSAASLAKAQLALGFMFLFVTVSLFLIVFFIFNHYQSGLYVLASLIAPLLGGVFGILLLQSMTDIQFDILSVIGFIIMLGTVANNSILLVDTAKRHAENGLASLQAISTAVIERKRSVYISSFTTIAGMVPLLLFPSEAGQIYKGIAIIIIGGMVFNLLTIFIVIPALMAQFGCSHEQPKRGNEKLFELQGAA